MLMTRTVVDQLLEEQPLLHPGSHSWAVSFKVLQRLESLVKPTDRTIETGGGYTTVVLASVGAHHTCVTCDLESVRLTREYLEKLGLEHKVTFLAEPSEVALPKIPSDEMFDFAFVDGGHSYPLPAIDWHFLDLHLRVGGVMGFDNVEIPSVHAHTEFLRINGSYRFVDRILHPPINYTVEFFEKLRDEPRSGVAQRFNHRRVTRNGLQDSLKTAFQGWLGREGKPWPWS